jgi:hypothetical protein
MLAIYFIGLQSVMKEINNYAGIINYAAPELNALFFSLEADIAQETA